MSRLFRELRRRHVIRSAVTYVVAAWVVVQGADLLVEAFDAPAWVMQLVVALSVLGLPVVLAISWFYEITSDGIRRTRDIEEDDVTARPVDRRISVIVIALLIAALGLSIYGNLREPEAPAEIVSVLIADFDNRTDQELYSGVVEDFLVVGLEVAPFVDAYSRKTASQIAAQIDGGKAGKALDMETATLVALREGINIVIAGAIERREDDLAITIEGVSAGDQQQLFALTEAVAAEADVLSAIAGVAKNLRIELGNAEKPDVAGEGESFAVTNLEAAAMYLKAQDLQLDRRLEEAVGFYEKALDLDPEFARAYAGLALTQQYLGQSEQATANWKEALARLNRLTERGRLRTLGNYYMINQGDYPRALDTYETLIAKYPADNVGANNLAVTAFYTMDFERALEMGREVARRYPRHSGYRANFALYAMYAGNFEEAREVSSALIIDDPSSAYAFIVQALSSLVVGDYAGAEAAYAQLVELDRFGRSIGLEGQADLAIYRRDFQRAIGILKAAIAEELAANAAHTVALKQVMLAEALLASDRPDDAAAALGAALGSGIGDPAVLVPAAMTAIGLGDLDTAASIADSLGASLSAQKRAYAKAVRAEIAAAGGDLASALRLLDEALSGADFWQIHLMRARLLLDAGRNGEARAELAICSARLGEGIAVYLNDRPSFRRLADLDALQRRADEAS